MDDTTTNQTPYTDGPEAADYLSAASTSYSGIATPSLPFSPSFVNQSRRNCLS